MGRWYGRALDLWLARTETPSRLVLERSRVKLRDYGNEGNRPSLLIIPAPIKKPYIWDLTPSVSVVLACLQARFRVYVLEWTEDGPDNGLAVYVDELILECAKAIGSRHLAQRAEPRRFTEELPLVALARSALERGRRRSSARPSPGRALDPR